LAERRPDGTPAVLHATQWARDAAATGLYEALGFLPVRYFIRMWADLTQEIPQPSFPGDLAVRACTADDEERLLEAHREAFAAHWGATLPELGRWKQERTDAGRYESDLWRLAVDGDQIVGFVLARPHVLTDATSGYVDDLGVVPSWRGRGLGLALLLDVFAALKGRGLVRAALNVDAENATGAVDLYRRAGMTAEPNLIIWERSPG
jgi:mycothiol synthase